MGGGGLGGVKNIQNLIGLFCFKFNLIFGLKYID